MAKYYVQSGSFRGMVDSYDEEAAAVWAIHRVMRIENSTALKTSNRSNEKTNTEERAETKEAADIGLFRLGDFIGVSERGFGRRDRVRIPTSQAVGRWIQLLHAIDSLCDRMDHAWDGP